LFLLGRLKSVCDSCVASAGLGLWPDDVLVQADTALYIVLIAVVISMYVVQVIRATPRQRRVLAFPTVGLVVAAAFAVAGLAPSLADPVHSAPFDLFLIVGLEVAGVSALPGGFLLGLLRERLDEARVSDLMAHLAVAPVASLGQALALALDDPSARLVFAAESGYVDEEGRPVPDAGGSRLTPIGDPADAFLLHDRSLDDQPELLASVRSAAALALDNARLRAELLAQLAEVRASRERLVEAGDTARRRLERNLHDGAQQRLVSLGLGLRLIRARIGDVDAQTSQLLAETEAQTRAAIGELRDLARGIHPTVLTEQGLAASLEQLAARCPLPVRLAVDTLPALPDAAAVTAYYVASEGIANIVKHADATEVWLEVRAGPDGIDVSIADNGVGGARQNPGSGLAGLTDRVAAVGGTLDLDSPPGRGTRLTAHIPISGSTA
jgi:signal transduction histidine kinase